MRIVHILQRPLVYCRRTWWAKATESTERSSITALSTSERKGFDASRIQKLQLPKIILYRRIIRI
jgi:hypothetical protein